MVEQCNCRAIQNNRYIHSIATDRSRQKEVLKSLLVCTIATMIWLAPQQVRINHFRRHLRESFSTVSLRDAETVVD